jgi:hypothetical protein
LSSIPDHRVNHFHHAKCKHSPCQTI